MSTPVRGAEGPLGYAPRWARGGGHDTATFNNRTVPTPVPVQELTPQQDLPPPRIVMPARDTAPARDLASARDVTSARETASAQDASTARGTISYRDSTPSGASAAEDVATVEDSVPTWKRKKRPPVFEGDTAIRELRARLADAPDQMPEPPLYQAKTPIFGVVARLMGVMVLAAVGALGFLWITAPHAAPPDSQIADQSDGQAALVSYRSLEAPQNPPAAQNLRAERVPEAPSSGGVWAVANHSSRDVTDGIGTPPTALAPRTLAPAAPRSPAARVSPPAVAPAPPPAAAVPPSRAPAPAVAAPVPTPAPQPSPVAASDRDEVAALLTRARAYLSAGDVAAARLVLRRAAERDDAQAALALGGTYDPGVLRRLGIINFHADPAQARDWYHKAAALGSPDASARLDQLVQTDR